MARLPPPYNLNLRSHGQLLSLFTLFIAEKLQMNNKINAIFVFIKIFVCYACLEKKIFFKQKKFALNFKSSVFHLEADLQYLLQSTFRFYCTNKLTYIIKMPNGETYRKILYLVFCLLNLFFLIKTLFKVIKGKKILPQQ